MIAHALRTALALALATALLAQHDSPPDSSFQALRAEDRAAQDAAVEALVSDCDGCVPHLLGIWRAIDRGDVRIRIADILTRLDPALALPALAELARALDSATDPDRRGILVRALASFGPPAADALVDDAIAHPDGYASALLQFLARDSDIDIAPAVRRLAASDDPAVRVKVLYGLLPSLPIAEQSVFTIACLTDADDRLRHTAAAFPDIPAWPPAERATHPTAFTAYTAALIDLLRADDPTVVAGVARTLRLIGPCTQTQGAITPLQAIALGHERPFWMRANALRALLALHDHRPTAVRLVTSILELHPQEVCLALIDTSPDEIDDALIRRIIAVAPQARGREDDYAAAILLRIGDRAVDPLITALRSPDLDTSGNAAAILARMGPSIRRAEPALIERLRAHPSGWQGEAYAAALIATRSDFREVREALTWLITRDTADPMDLYVAGNTLRALMLAHPDAEWVRDLARPVAHNPAHPLREWVVPAEQSAGADAPEPIAAPAPDLDTLLHTIRFGTDSDPAHALVSLGALRPTTPDILAVIREHLADIRPSMRMAAVAAAAAAGPSAAPLIDDLITLGRTPGRVYHHDVAAALSRIAPADPRTAEFSTPR